MKTIITIISFAMMFPLVLAFGADDAGVPIKLTLYSRDIELSASTEFPLVVEIDYAGPEEIKIDGLIQMQTINGVKDDFELSKYDSISGGYRVNGYTLVVTAYQAWRFGGASAGDSVVPKEFNLLGGEPFFIKVAGQSRLIAPGKNRIRVSLFKNGQCVAVSNTIIFHGSAGPNTQPSATREH